MKEVYRPVPAHSCSPGWIEKREADGFRHYVMGRYPIGTILECECGKQWKAFDDPRNYATRGQRSVDSVVWQEYKPKSERKRWWTRKGS